MSEILQILDKIQKKAPSLRLGQVIGNAVPADVMDRINNDLYYMPDEELLGYLTTYYRLHCTASPH